MGKLGLGNRRNPLRRLFARKTIGDLLSKLWETGVGQSLQKGINVVVNQQPATDRLQLPGIGTQVVGLDGFSIDQGGNQFTSYIVDQRFGT